MLLRPLPRLKRRRFLAFTLPSAPALGFVDEGAAHSRHARPIALTSLRFCAQRRQPRRRQVCARRDALSSWHEVRRPLPHRPGPSTRARDRRLRSEAPPAPAAPSCRGHTGAPQARLDPPPRTALRRRLVSILHPGRPCAAGSSRSSTPDALAPQARLDPPRGWRAGSAWAPALGSHCGLRGRLRHRRAARSEPIVHALQVPRPAPPSPARASRLLRLSRALCVAPLSASRPRPRRARLPTPAPRPRQIGSRGRRRGCSSARTSPPTGREECSEL